jgi:hypothetical protein
MSTEFGVERLGSHESGKGVGIDNHAIATQLAVPRKRYEPHARFKDQRLKEGRVEWF